MIELNLFKEKFRDFGETSYRLLLENTEITAYIWVAENGMVKKVQVNQGEELFAEIALDGRIKFYRISNVPINRSIINDLTAEQKREIAEITGKINCSDLENLFSQIRAAAKGNGSPFMLNEKEVCIIESLTPVDSPRSLTNKDY